MTNLFSFINTNPSSANLLAAIASAVAAALAFLSSCVAAYISYSSLRHQRMHNALSVRPLPEISCVDYEDQLRVKLRNNGVGPLLVARLVVGNGREVRRQLLDWMPDLPGEFAYSNFAGDIDGRSISPGNSIVLLEFVGDEQDTAFAGVRDKLRAALMDLSVNVEYTDVYETVMPPHRKSLEWFGRRLA